MNSTPSFIGNGQFACVQVTTAVTFAGDQPNANTVTALTLKAGIQSILLSAQVKGSPVANSTAGQIYIWLYDGTTYYLVKEIVITAITVGAGTAAFDSGAVAFGLNGAGYVIDAKAAATQWSVVVGTKNSEHYQVIIQCGN